MSQPLGTANQKEVELFHRNSDLNKSKEAQHHTLTRGGAAPYEHTHNGVDSVALLTGILLSGSCTTNTAAVLKQVCIALGTLGATDGTTP